MFARNLFTIYLLVSLFLFIFSISVLLITFGINLYLGLQFVAYTGWILGVLLVFFFVVSWPVGTLFGRNSIRLASVVFALAGIMIGVSGFLLVYYLGTSLIVFVFYGSWFLQVSVLLLALAFILLGYGYFNVGVNRSKLLYIGSVLLIIGALIQVIAAVGLLIVGYSLSRIDEVRDLRFPIS